MFKKFAKISLNSIIVLGTSLAIISYKSGINNEVKINKFKTRAIELNNLNKNINYLKNNELLLNFDNSKNIKIDKNILSNEFSKINSIPNKIDLKQLANTLKILKNWKKKIKSNKFLKLSKEKTNNSNNISNKVKTAISSALGISVAAIAGFFLIKYGRYITNKAEAYVADIALKKYLKHKEIDFDLEDNFKNLVFNILWENQYKDRELVSWSLRKLKEKFYDGKEFPNSEQPIKWLEEFNDEQKLKTTNDNPFNFILNMLKGEQGAEILKALIKLIKKISDKTDVITKLGITDSLGISDLLKSKQITNTITSSLSSLFLSIGPFKNGLQWLIDKGKNIIKDNKTKSYFSVWLEFAKALRKIINLDSFKTKYASELQVIYDFQYNLLIKLVGDTELIDSSKWSSISWFLPTIKYKVSDIITPLLIKSWFEDLGSGVVLKEK